MRFILNHMNKLHDVLNTDNDGILIRLSSAAVKKLNFPVFGQPCLLQKLNDSLF